ncbi:MAG: hypothetical protein LBM60_01450 [Clostridium sp.]|jgi:hypothetical protein|nr:hypothetical protein [Clostridium sp.]
MSNFAVVDTETTWNDEVMSIGIVLADGETFERIDQRYYILTPYKDYGGMFSDTLYIKGLPADFEGSRELAMHDILAFLAAYEIKAMFAYNAVFDYRHLPELSHLAWYDIMKIAAYRQHNHKIHQFADCYTTGRLKRGYGVQDIYRLLSEDLKYCEVHNALADALDELEIMKLLGHGLGRYVRL